MKNCNLYVILDREVIGHKNILKVADQVLRGGADIIQLRDKISADTILIKEAKALKRIAGKYKKPFIVNDRPDIAFLADADGVHLGREDMPIKYARKILPGKIIGASTHTMRQAVKAQRDGANYIGVGPIFKTASKKGLEPIGPAVLRAVNKKIRIPFFAIGGISAANLKVIKSTGAKRIAVISAVVKTKNIYKSTSLLRRKLGRPTV